jgi:SAM-dependent methyltransferase
MDINFLERVLLLKKGDKIFDCPCGHGRHSVELARRGYEVTGQDINSFFLSKAVKESRLLNLSVKWVRGDMRKIQFKSEFDIALCLFSSLGYLENDKEHQKVLEQNTKALKRGGKFVLDVINRDFFVRTYQEKSWKELADGSIITCKNNFNHTTGYNLETRVRIWKNGKRDEVSHFVRMYTIPELITMLNKAGLSIDKMYGDFDESSITFHSKRYILVAVKD